MNRQNMNRNIRPVGGADKTSRAGQTMQVRRPATNNPPVQRKPSQNGWVMPERAPTAGQQRTGANYTQMPLRPIASMPRKDAHEVAKQGYRTFAHTQELQIQRPAHTPPSQTRSGGRNMPYTAAQDRRRPSGQRISPDGHHERRPSPGEVQRTAVRQGMPPSPPEGTRQRSVQNVRPANSAPKNRTAPPLQQRKRPEAYKRPQSSGWVIPEGSAVYTAQGKIYEPRSMRPDDRRTRVQKGPNQPPRRNLRPNKPRPKEKKKFFNKEKFFLYTKTFFIRLAVMLLTVSILGLWWYRSEFHSSQNQRSGEVLCSFPGVGEYTADGANSYFGDVLYVDFTEVSEWFGMVSVGSVSCMRFICPNGPSQTSAGNGGEEYAIFTDESTTVLINGSVVILEAECRTQGSHIWIPLSFVENYVSGVSCKRSAKGSEITFSVPGAEDTDSEEITVDASFKVKAQNALAHVEYPD